MTTEESFLFLVNSYRMKALPPYQTFYTVALLQLLGIPDIQLSFEKILNARLWEGVFPAAFEEKFRRRQDAKNKKKRENQADNFDDEMDDESVTVDENQLHDVLRYLQKAGYVRKVRKEGKDKYCLVKNPLEGLNHQEVDILLAFPLEKIYHCNIRQNFCHSFSYFISWKRRSFGKNAANKNFPIAPHPGQRSSLLPTCGFAPRKNIVEQNSTFLP